MFEIEGIGNTFLRPEGSAFRALASKPRRLMKRAGPFLLSALSCLDHG